MNKELLIKEQGLEAFELIRKFTGNDFETSLILRTNDLFNIESIESKSYQTIVNLNKINDINIILGQYQLETIHQFINILKNKNKSEKLEFLKNNNKQKCVQWCEKYKI